MRIEQTSIWKRKVKKLHPQQKQSLDNAVREIAENPKVGQLKKGILKNVRVYKFSMNKQLTLCAYIHPEEDRIILLDIGTHENFYRELEHHSYL